MILVSNAMRKDPKNKQVITMPSLHPVRYCALSLGSFVAGIAAVVVVVVVVLDTAFLD